MTSLLPRKPRTTAPATRGRTAGSLAAVLLAAGGATALPPAPAPAPAAQPPGGLFQEKAPDRPGPRPTEAPGVRPLDPSQTALPSRDVIFTMYDDARLKREVLARTRENLQAREDEQAKADGRKPNVVGDPTPFPAAKPVVPPGTPYVAKTGSYPPLTEYVEPAFVVHRRLHFEEKNSERYGWDLGIIQPFVSTAAFYKDALLWPNSLASGLEVGFWDTSAGKCLPGTPVPYYLYPPGLTVTGMAAELGVFTAGSFILNPVNAGNALIGRPLVR